MTSIGGYRQAALPANQPSLPNLAVGQSVQARVLGPSRHGVSVQIGQERLQLDVPSRLADARTLTLQGTATSSAAGQRVRIVARDDRPLSQPIMADLIAKPKPSPPSASDIVHKNEIKVVAQPVNPDGKAQGSSVTLHLQAAPPEVAAKATAEQAGQKADPSTPKTVENRPATTPDTPSRAPTTADRQTQFSPSPVRQHGMPVADPGGSGDAVPRPIAQNVGLAQKSSTAQAVASTSVASTSSQPAPNTGSADGLRLQGDRSAPHGSASSLTRPAGVEPAVIKSADASGVSTYRGGRVQEPALQSKPLSQVTPPLMQQTTVDRKATAMATVVGHTDAGKVILKAADQHFRIEQQIDLPLGTTLQATLSSGLSAIAMPFDPRTVGNRATPLTKLIELLDDIDRAGQRAAEADQPSPTKQLPAPDRHLASKFLGLLAMKHGQSLDGRLSPSPDHSGVGAAQRDQIQVLVRELGAATSESLADGWKGLTLPLGSDQGQAVALYFRDHDLDPDDEGQDGDAEHAETKRAVFDVSFSQLGRCQIDALCQKQRFDLLIRSEMPLLQEDQQDIASLFVSACEIAGMTGEIGFKIGHFFEPARSPAAIKGVRT